MGAKDYGKWGMVDGGGKGPGTLHPHLSQLLPFKILALRVLIHWRAREERAGGAPERVQLGHKGPTVLLGRFPSLSVSSPRAWGSAARMTGHW